MSDGPSGSTSAPPASFALPGSGSAAGMMTAASRGRLQHAYLLLHEPPPSGQSNQHGGPFDRVSFQFNPKELSISRSANWTPQPPVQGATQTSSAQYNGPQPAQLTVEMFFDASSVHTGTVRSNVEKLFSCCRSRPGRPEGQAAPPWVKFCWGEFTEFMARVTSVQARYSLFSPSGTPIRATCSVTLVEVTSPEPSQPPQNPTSGGLFPRRVHTLIEGDNLAAIAYREYGDPSLWRAVADVNGIDDPMRLRAGRSILLPIAQELTRSHRADRLIATAPPTKEARSAR